MSLPVAVGTSRGLVSRRAAGLGSSVFAATFGCGSSMSFLALVASVSGGDDAGSDHEEERDRDERECRAPAAGLGAWVRLCCVREDLRGQRGVGPTEHVRVRGSDREDGEQQRSRLTRGPGYGQQDTADDAAECG